jgi:hypothetical protein
LIYEILNTTNEKKLYIYIYDAGNKEMWELCHLLSKQVRMTYTNVTNITTFH